MAYLTPKQIAADLGVTPKTVRSWCQTGQLRAHQFVTLWRIAEEDYAHFKERCLARPHHETGPILFSDRVRKG